MTRVQRPIILSALTLALLIMALVVTGLVLPAGAQSGDLLPTPTMEPIDDAPYELTVVGGAAETYTFGYDDQDGFTFGGATVTSEYPSGMTFKLDASSANGEIVNAILFIRFVHDSGTRVTADYDAQEGVWVARPWASGGRPAWSHFDFHWRVRDETGASVDTPAYPMDYFDPEHEWFRAETDHVVLYWRSFGDDQPDEIAQTMANYLAGIQTRREQGFGRALSYKPIAVVYPDRESLSAMYGSGVSNTRAAGFTSSDLGMSVQVLRGTDYAPNQENCIYSIPPEDWTMERRINTIYTTTAHETTHLYQYDVLGGPLGPEWWSEGQPEWFANTARNYDERLRHLASLQDLPSLYTQIGSDLNQADGCYALSYNVGPSFINYLLTHYGGLETHREIAQRMRRNASVYAAIEEVTGKPFLEIENEWRAYLGFRALTPADIDPALALEPYEDPLLAVGETVTLPPTPALVSIYEVPKARALASGQCFANMQVTILSMGQLDGVPYFEVDCMGQKGWMTRDQIVGPGQ